MNRTPDAKVEDMVRPGRLSGVSEVALLHDLMTRGARKKALRERFSGAPKLNRHQRRRSANKGHTRS